MSCYAKPMDGASSGNCERPAARDTPDSEVVMLRGGSGQGGWRLLHPLSGRFASTGKDKERPTCKDLELARRLSEF